VFLLTGSHAATPRDPWLRPFTSHSIWNTPIGSSAQYTPAGFPAEANGVNFDQDIVMKTSGSDPARPWYQPGSWSYRCSGSYNTGKTIRLPDTFLVADPNGSQNTPNYAGTFLRPDGRTTDNTSAVARCSPTGPIYGYSSGNPARDATDIYGDGQLGSHGASSLSSFGGLIRPGELSSSDPIQHVLDLVLYVKYVNYGTSKGFRWPAISADAYASPSTYAGSNVETKMGSLLAIPPNITPASAGITSPVALKMFHALQDYGAYLTDDSAWEASYISIDRSAIGTFTWGSAEQQQVNKLISMLNDVTNNSPTSIGGGGTPRQPFLPELIDPAATTPTPTPTIAPTPTPAPIAPISIPYYQSTTAANYTDQAGHTWKPNNSYFIFPDTASDHSYSTSTAISGTSDQPLYQSEIYGPSSYNLPIANGTYKVSLGFAEINPSSGTRVFNVSAENQSWLTNFDITAKVGTYAADIETKNITVTDGTLNLNFTGIQNSPKISYISVEPAIIPTPTPAPTVSPPPPPAVSPTPTPTTISVSGDISGDGHVTSLDLAILLSHWNITSGASRAQGDLSGDGKVTSLDLAILLSNWGK
jgi:hypothetical protein